MKKTYKKTTKEVKFIIIIWYNIKVEKKYLYERICITNKMLNNVSSIMKKVGKLDNYKDLNKMPILRRNNRIISIHSSLSIEANSLSFNQVKDIIDGKLVIGEQKDIQEVKMFIMLILKLEKLILIK